MSKERPIRQGAGWKFMMVLSPKVYGLVARKARERHITVQEYLRVVAIPEHLGLDRPNKIQSLPKNKGLVTIEPIETRK